MGTHKISSYIVQYRAKKKEAAEEERRRRIEDMKRRPEIVDPSFEILGLQAPPLDSNHDDRSTITPTASSASPASTADDWLFQTRRASTIPSTAYQLEPYCEVTPKSSVTSNNSAASDAPRPQDYDMGWEVSSSARPRPQSYLPSSTSASYSVSMADLHRGSEHQSRRRTLQVTNHERNESAPSHEGSSSAQPSLRLEASLTKPFSIDDPF